MKRRAAATLAVVALTAGLLVAAPRALAELGFGASPYQHFVGALHEHSGYSDGFPGSRPADYFASAKGFGLDFLGSGEHSDNADVPITFSEYCLTPDIAECAVADKENPEDSFRKWDATLEQARAATNESFTGFRGFEWSSDRYGHINVYFSEHDTNAKIDGGYAAMESFWEWFLRSPSLGGGSDGLGTFNHPGDKSQQPLDGFNWNDFAYVPEADQRMVGIEVFNGTKDYEVPGRAFYSRALDKGWHVGAIGAEDKGHDPSDGDGQPDANGITDDWGGEKWAKTVVIATDKTEEGLREAMLARRIYAVLDNSIRIDLDAGGQPMGSRIATTDATVPITVTSNGGTRIELVTNGGIVAAASDGTSLSFAAPVTTDERYYFARILDGSKPVAYTSPVWIRGESDAGQGRWLAGDLHIHTTYSHDSYGGPGDDNTGPEEFYTLGHPPTSQFAVAASRGLHYLAITDHNDIRSQNDPGWAAAEDLGLIPVGGYESSLRGHAQFLGIDRCYASTGAYDGPDCSAHGDTSAAGVDATADAIRADGGVFQVNHPMEGSVDHPNDPDWGYGYDVVPDTIEVWNISRLWQPPAPSASSNDDAVKWWESWLDRGHRIGATGGSDNHYLATTPVQGAGQPTTWVFATGDDEQAVVDGLAAGRTFISHQPPAHGGPRLFLEGDGDGNGTFEAIVGDDVPPGSELRVRVENAAGSLLRVLTDGGNEAFEPVPVTSPFFEHRFTLPADKTWVRAEIVEPDGQEQRRAACDGALGSQTTYCRNKLLVLGMTSALFLTEPDPEPTETPTEDPSESPTVSASPSASPGATATSLTFTESSATEGQYSDDATFEVRLTTEDGAPLAGRDVTFELTGSERTDAETATTDDDGIARATFTLDQPPGPHQLTARYAGEENVYEPSSNTTSIVVDHEDTELALEVVGNGAKRRLVAVLTDHDSGAGIDGRDIDFYVDGVLVGSAPTDRSGRATFEPSNRDKAGKHDYEARFEGDDFYRSSNGTAST